jgi:hypothetical protein
MAERRDLQFILDYRLQLETGTNYWGLTRYFCVAKKVLKSPSHFATHRR